MNMRDLFLAKRFGGGGSVGGSGVTIKNQNKTFTENGTYKADSGYTGLGTVTVNVPETEPVLETLAVTENGEYTPGSGVDGFSKVTVDVASAGGGGYGVNELINRSEPSGDLVHTDSSCTDLPEYIFRGCINITSFESEHILTIGNCVFNNCLGLKSVNMPNVTKLAQSLFQNCNALESVNMPNVTNVNAATVFQGCSVLKSVSFPKANTTTGATMFQHCKALEFVDLGNITSLNMWLFNGCTNLKTIILRNTTLVPLTTNNILLATPFDTNGTGGTVYVPSSLITEYQTATNWSTYYEAGTCEFVALEGSEYE